MKLKTVLAVIFLVLLSCEEQSSLPTENNVKFERKRFTATSIKKVFLKQPSLTSNHSASYLGFVETDGQKVYARPFFTIFLDDEKYFNTKTNKSLLRDSKFQFKLKTDSTISKTWNSNFSQNVNLRSTAIAFSQDTLFKSNSLWGDNRYKPVQDFTDDLNPNTSFINTLSSKTINSLDHSTDTINTFDIVASSMDKLYQKYIVKKDSLTKAGTNDSVIYNQKVLISGFFLDLNSFDTPAGMIAIDYETQPVLFVNYHDTASNSIKTDTLKASATTTWFSYQTMNNQDSNIYLKDSDREALVLNFFSDSLNNFLNSKKLYGAALYLKSEIPDNHVSGLEAISYKTVSTSSGFEYFDNYLTTELSELGSHGSVKLSPKVIDSHTPIEFYNQQLTTNNNKILLSWILGNRKTGELVLRADSKNSPGFSKFSPNELKNYMIDIYYEVEETN